MNNKLFVGSLPFSTREPELNQLFANYGQVVSARVVTDKMTGRSKGFGFVEFDTEESAKKAVEALHDTEFQGRKIIVNYARPQENSGHGGGPRRNNDRGGRPPRRQFDR